MEGCASGLVARCDQGRCTCDRARRRGTCPLHPARGLTGRSVWPGPPAWRTATRAERGGFRRSASELRLEEGHRLWPRVLGGFCVRLAVLLATEEPVPG